MGHRKSERCAGRSVLVAPDSFKGTLTALEAAEAMAQGALEVGAQVSIQPMADGGEGTAEVLCNALGGHMLELDAEDALGRPVKARAAALGKGIYAVDAASACGLWRLSEPEVLKASSHGLGLQIRTLLRKGAQRILVGVGGTAFVEGGVGVAVALGARLLDPGGRELPPTPEGLLAASRLDWSGLDQAALDTEYVLLLDVDNPLLGPEGAARVYGPQKGAVGKQIPMLERALARYFQLVVQARRQLHETRPGGADLDAGFSPELPGMGAGGGLAVSLVGLLGARMEPGCPFVGEAVGLAASVTAADLVVTGEGRYDGQSAFGKVPWFVGELAARMGRPAILVAGQTAPGAPKGPFGWVVAASPPGHVPVPQEARRLLTEATRDAVSQWCETNGADD